MLFTIVSASLKERADIRFNDSPSFADRRSGLPVRLPSSMDVRSGDVHIPQHWDAHDHLTYGSLPFGGDAFIAADVHPHPMNNARGFLATTGLVTDDATYSSEYAYATAPVPSSCVDQAMNVPWGGPSSLVPEEHIDTPRFVYFHQALSPAIPATIVEASHSAADDSEVLSRNDSSSPSSTISSLPVV
jgi:hypothetical protein